MSILRWFQFLFGVLLLSLLPFSVLAQDRLSHEIGQNSTIEKASNPQSLPATIPVQRSATVKENNTIGSVSGAIGIVFLVLVIGLVYFRSQKPQLKLRAALFGGDEQGKHLKLERQLPLTPKHSLHLVSWNDREILLACTDGAITVIGETPVTKSANTTDKLTSLDENIEGVHHG